MPDAHESCRNAPSQPHKCSRFTVYIKPSGKTQECICFLARKFTEMVRTVSTRANWAGILRRGAGAQADRDSRGTHGERLSADFSRSAFISGRGRWPAFSSVVDRVAAGLSPRCYWPKLVRRRREWKPPRRPDPDSTVEIGLDIPCLERNIVRRNRMAARCRSSWLIAGRKGHYR